MIRKTAGAILEELELTGEVPKNWREIITEKMKQLSLAGPWHSRLLIGFGAWISSLLFIGFLSALGLSMGGIGIYGVVLLIASLTLNKFQQGTFWDQAVLAFSLSGQAFMIVFITKDMPARDSFKIVSLFVIGFNFVWPVLLKTPTQAFLSAIFLSAGLVMSAFAFEVRFLVPFVPGFLFFAAAYIVSNEPKFFKNSIVETLPAMAGGLLFGGVGAVSLSTYYIFEAFRTKGDEIYPFPGITSALVLLAIFYFCARSKDVLFKTRGSVAYAALLIIGAISFKAPGIIFALGVAIVGAVYLERTWLWLGLLFGACFTTLFIYGSDLTLINKSYILFGLGGAFFVFRKLLPGKKSEVA